MSSDSSEASGRAPEPRLARVVRHATGAFVLFHVLAMLLAALPAPGDALNPATWSNPTVRLELEEWAARLHTDPDALGRRVVGWARTWITARRALLEPFQPYINATGCEQSWTMFVAADRFPTRFQLRARRAGSDADAWETVFEERSAEHRWRARFFEHDRVRGALLEEAWPRYRGDYMSTCAYLARELFREDAAYEAVECRFLRTESPSAKEVLAGVEHETKYELPHVVTRGDVGP